MSNTIKDAVTHLSDGNKIEFMKSMKSAFYEKLAENESFKKIDGEIKKYASLAEEGKKEKLKEADEGEADTFFAGLNIKNIQSLYTTAMEAKNAKDLEKKMLSMKREFQNAKKIDFKKVDWEKVYAHINE